MKSHFPCVKGQWLLRLIRRCREAGYARLVIEGKEYAYSKGMGYYGHVEALYDVNDPDGPSRKNAFGGPALWQIVDDLRINGGCGNGGRGVHQYQITVEGYGAPILPGGATHSFDLNPHEGITLGEPIFIGRRKLF